MDEKYGSEYLENIIRGNEIKGRNDLATTARNHLCRSFKASKVAERKFEHFQQIKKEQEIILKQLSTENNWWYSNHNLHFLTEGGESKIYFEEIGKHVIKYNDAIYYNTWLDFLNNILLHNLFFPSTNYTLLGFSIKDDILFAALKQRYYIANEITSLNDIKETLELYGFKHLKRFDYFHPEYNIVIEDLHDENVLTVENKLFFIDTIFLLQ